MMLCIALGATAMVGQQAAENSSPYDKWLNEDVVYIIKEAERTAFKGLKTDAEREHFIEQFWSRRGKGFREEHYRRIAYANNRFRQGDVFGWKTDRGRTYIQYGPPDELELHPPDREKWLYRHLEGGGDDVIFEFSGGKAS